MSRKRRLIYAAIISLTMLMLLYIFLMTSGRPDIAVLFSNEIPSYKNLLDPSDRPYHIAYEVQASGLIKAGVAKEYRTDFVSTVIIAVDRDRVSDEITGWESLRHGGYDVYFEHRGRVSHISFGFTVLSIAAGLDADDGGIGNAILLLKNLHRSGRLISSDPADAPVAIMFDHEAAVRYNDGRNIEIIVPKEGTLSLHTGVMSTYGNELPKIRRSDLITAGFRMPDGEADFRIYPDNTKYSVAQRAVLTRKSVMTMISVITSFRRSALGQRRFSAAHGAENMLIYLVFIIITVLWSGMLYLRISDVSLRRKLFAILVILLFWMLGRVIKMLVPLGLTDRYLWYLFYIPLTMLPAMLFWVGQTLKRIEHTLISKVIRNFVFTVSIILALLVLTNDIHQMAFEFYRGTQGMNYDQYYYYGWVYYLIFAWSIFLILVFVFMTVRKETKPFAEHAGPLLLVLFIAIIYFGGYAAGITVFRESEFTIVYGMMSLVFLEICLRSRIIPNNTRLTGLLRNTPVDMHILSDVMQIEYKTDNAQELQEDVVSYIRSKQKEPHTPLGFSLPDNESILYGIYRINGGYTVFTQHLDPVIRLRAVLKEQNDKIEAQNSILERAQKAKAEIVRIRTQQELFTRIDGVLKERVDVINSLIHVLSAKTDYENKEETQKQLAVIKVLVNYCKRRGNLALQEAGDEFCDSTSLALWLRESLWEANQAGVEGLVTETGATDISSTNAALLYDCFEDMLENAMRSKTAVMIINQSVAEDRFIMSAVVSMKDIFYPADHQFKKSVNDALLAADALIETGAHDEGFMIKIIIRTKRDKYD